jgi:hypothetical protein
MEQTKVIERTQEDLEGFAPADGKGRMYDHRITVAGIEHHFYSNKKDLVDFKVGEEATFTVEQKQGKQGVRYVIKPVRKTPVFTKGGGGFQGKSNYSKDDAQITALSILSSLMTGYQQSTEVFSREKIEKEFDFWYEKVKSKRGDFN